MSLPEAGPSFTPSNIVVSPMIPTVQQNGKRSRGPSTVVESTASDKGKEVEREPIKRISLSNTPPADHIIDLSVSSPHSPISPRPLARNGPSSVHLDRPQTRPNVSGMLDSSDLDRVSTALLPAGKPLPPTPPPSAAVADSAPQAKKPRLGPPPLPSGPPSVRTLHILLGPEHVEENRPKRFFELVRARELKQPLVKLSPPELREILERMRKVNEIWLRTMAEDDGNLQCLATWLKLFINNPKLFEGSIVNLLWVILRAKPSLDKIKTARLGTLAKQALEKAKQNNLAKTPDIEKAVSFLDQLVEKARNARSATATAGPSGTDAGGAPKALPSFRKNTASANAVAGPSTSASASTSTAGPSVMPRMPEMTPLQKLLADATAAGVAREKAARAAAAPPPTNGRVMPQPQVNATAGPGPSTSSAFRSVPGPTPMVSAGRSSSSSNVHNNNNNNSRPSSSSGETSYPSVSNRWSSVATPEGRDRPHDNKKRRNYKNCTVNYQDAALAEAREFEMDEVEADEPDWWKYKSNPLGHTSHELDQEEGHSMRHLAHGDHHTEVHTIPWHEPEPYDWQIPDHQGPPPDTTNTPENVVQDHRERGELNVRYESARQIPMTPDESRARNVSWGHDTLHIPFTPRAYIPPPPPRPPMNAYGRPPMPMPLPFPLGNNGFQPPQGAPPPAAASSAFRPRNGGGVAAPQAPPQGGSSAYRPRATSAPLVPQVKTEVKTEQDAALARRNSVPGPVEPKPKSWIAPSNNPPPLPDRAGINSVWRRTAKPRKSALLNPLSARQVSENVQHMRNAPPHDYDRFTGDLALDEDGASSPPRMPNGSASKQ